MDSLHHRLPIGHDFVSSCQCCYFAALASMSYCRQRRPFRTPRMVRGVCHARGPAKSRSTVLYVNLPRGCKNLTPSATVTS
jgi:hypothetical protein